MTAVEWCEETYNQCLTRKAFWYSPYDASWDECAQYGEDAKHDIEFQQLVEMEYRLETIPDWVGQLVPGIMRLLPPCGHAEFPLAYLEIVSAIGDEKVPEFNHGCYTASPRWKSRMADYLFCLDAWLAQVGPDDAASELTQCGTEHVDWHKVCRDLWSVLGERTPAKELLVERVLHRQRWWLKTCIWDGDHRNSYCRDRYLGDITPTDEDYGNPPFGDPYFAELSSPRVKRLESQLDELYPEWSQIKGLIECSWLCAPKAFRFLERVLWFIGQSSMETEGKHIPSFLQIEDTCPDHASASEWWKSYLDALNRWWQGEPATGDIANDIYGRLRESTPVKQWLVRLLRYKCILYQRHAEIARLVGPIT